MRSRTVTPRPPSRRTEGGAFRVPVFILAGHAWQRPALDRPRVLVLTDGLELGRDRATDSWLIDLEDDQLSRRHARLSLLAKPSDTSPDPSDDTWVISDLGSTNGTWVNGARVPAGVALELAPGATVMLGAHVFVFRRVTGDELAAIREDWACPLAPVPTLSPTMATLARKLDLLARADVDLLLNGETGVGKEVHAAGIHKASGRKGPFVAIDCASIPDNLVESELFGFARGAHSTADRSKAGLIERADGGTLFLDELGEMSQVAQAKLLRFLQTRELQTLGSTQTRRLDVRVVAATNRPVGTAKPATEGLRDDLAARLGPEPVTLPPLRERPEDIGLLVDFFAKGALGFCPMAYAALFQHAWKGNVRELEKVVALARVLAGAGKTIGLEHLPVPLTPGPTAPAEPAALAARRRPTRDELEHLLGVHGGDVAQLARDIGRQRTLVWRWLRQDNLSPAAFRGFRS